ncbi:uncharacterized protein TNCV_3152311 [Trichonephila clavipes]|nr:uncharacterized protein TNCV_3152311 [Trichonephila clavipes]
MSTLTITHLFGNPDLAHVVRVKLATMCFVLYMANTVAIGRYSKLSQKKKYHNNSQDRSRCMTKNELPHTKPDSQAKNDTTVASNIELKTASASRLEGLKDNFLENSGNCDEIFGHRIFDVTTLLSVFALLCCSVCLHDELSLTEDSSNKFKLNILIAFALRVIGKGYRAGNKLLGMMDLPFLSKTAFRNEELNIQQAASIVPIESMKNAATEVKN